MKLSTIVEAHRCFRMLRESEADGSKLSPEQYLDCIRAYSVFTVEVEILLQKTEVEVTE